MDARPKRRWYQFTLRTLFVVMTVFALWLGWQINWFRSRQAWLEAKDYVGAFPAVGLRKVPHPHFLLTLFRQEAMSQILLRNATEEEVAKVQRLFPEANVVSGNWPAPSLGDPVWIGKRALPDVVETSP